MSARRRGSLALRPALVWLACAGWLWSGVFGYAQLRLGTLTGTVHDASGAAVPGAAVSLSNPLSGFHATTTSDAQGRFVLARVPFGELRLEATSPGLQARPRTVTIQTELPLNVDVELAPAAVRTSVVVEGATGRPAVTATLGLDARRVELVPQALPTQALQNLVALAPGVTVQHGGLVHVRGVEDGLLFVVDGAPLVDRLDALHAPGLDPRGFGTVEVAVGHMPAGFGGRSAAVVSLLPGALPETPPYSLAAAGVASAASADLRAEHGRRVGRTFGLYGTATASLSDRYLDAVHPENLHNEGRRATLFARGEWQPAAGDRLSFSVLGGGAGLDVPNDEIQEAAGQDQRESLRQVSPMASWQRVWGPATVSRLTVFHHRFGSRLHGSDRDTPLFAEADRHHDRTGATFSVTRSAGPVVLEGGLSAVRTGVREAFTFAVTDAALAEERFVSEPALAFTRESPFEFHAEAEGTRAGAYLQALLAAGPHASLSAGLRFDRAGLPEPAREWSPRLAAAARLPWTGTTVRAAVDRLFMPPQLENLLLASSPEARQLSPFADESGGGAPVRPERVTAWEIGGTQEIGRHLQLDVAHWGRQFDDTADPNVFFNTTIVFPNTVAEGEARGTDVRLGLRERGGFSADVGYTFSRITHVGPITGGLFLTDEFEEIGPGTRFTPDHDQRHIATARASYRPAGGVWWVSLLARYQDGVPLEVEDEALEALRQRPGAELVDWDRERVRRWATLDAAFSVRLLRNATRSVFLRVDVQNLADRDYAYNFGNPFEGTHFGPPRLWRAGIDVRF